MTETRLRRGSPTSGRRSSPVRQKPIADDAVYVCIAPYAVAKTEEIVPGRVFFDRCSHGHIVGVEIIGGKVEHEPIKATP